MPRERRGGVHSLLRERARVETANRRRWVASSGGVREGGKGGGRARRLTCICAPRFRFPKGSPRRAGPGPAREKAVSDNRKPERVGREGYQTTGAGKRPVRPENGRGARCERARSTSRHGRVGRGENETASREGRAEVGTHLGGSLIVFKPPTSVLVPWGARVARGGFFLQRAAARTRRRPEGGPVPPSGPCPHQFPKGEWGLP